MNVSFRVVAALAVLASVALVGPAAAREASPPVITLLSPTNGSTIVSSVTTTTYPTFTWQIAWDVPEQTVVMWEIASDTAFTQKVTQENHLCPATDVNCWDSFQPRSVYGPPYGNVWYWRVGLTTSGGTVYSQTFTFKAVNESGPVSFECRLDSASFQPCTSPYTTARLAKGTHTFQVRARDAAGNVDPSPASRSFKET